MITSSTDRAAPAAPPTTHDAPRRLRVLLVEHDAADAATIAGYFGDCAECRSTGDVERVSRMAQACERLARLRFDVVLFDLSLPDGRGLAGVATLVAAAPDVPVVVMAEAADDALAVAAVKAGAQDYLTKRQDDGRVVRHAVRHAIERQRLRREREGLLVREREARAAAERATRVRDEVLGMVSHDLRSPLTAIAVSGNALLDGSGDPSVLASAIVRSSEWALRIIRDLLDVTAIEAGGLTIHREPMTAQAITEMLWSMFAPSAAGAGVTLVVERTESALWVDADVDRVVQAVGNLVGNAIKFTPRGGRVSLAVSRGDNAVRFRVEDTGCGIAPENMPRLFDRFWQAHETGRGGAGLGLVIAQGIAEGHGGRIEVESRPGVGSTFTFVLPEQP
ncbi:ATP-binding region ATPase domain protein (plasmid) [Gemmatirosa kalamazoonensis]|uniref:histidine kinase n=1 Tax=Gemmatirosa kalamazoonensis TaxID=861299 RepID=W0RQG1_9BACT|nr:ATP-binding protein [Gemmatirosa kalamazoonensis]AHG93214.1 ATP-binding region ATPase domain protein [Gemmatirosa kalamazoonensis]